MTLTLLKTCTFCDEELHKNARNCEACGAFYEVRKTAIKSMYMMAGVMGFGLITIGNGFYQTLKSGEQLDTVMSIVLPAMMLLMAALGWWFLKQAQRPSEWTEWTEGAPEFADMKILEAGGALPGLGGDKT